MNDKEHNQVYSWIQQEGRYYWIREGTTISKLKEVRLDAVISSVCILCRQLINHTDSATPASAAGPGRPTVPKTARSCATTMTQQER